MTITYLLPIPLTAVVVAINDSKLSNVKLHISYLSFVYEDFGTHLRVTSAFGEKKFLSLHLFLFCSQDLELSSSRKSKLPRARRCLWGPGAPLLGFPTRAFQRYNI